MFSSHTIIRGTGCYIPENVIYNRDFGVHDFYGEDGEKIGKKPEVIIRKFREITGIEERRYAPSRMVNSDMGVEASRRAIEDAGIDPETIDQIIYAHNFGNIAPHTLQPDCCPSLAARVKHKLGIKNTSCIAYDVLFGCPGWVQALIQADCFIRAGVAKRCLVIGGETLSRIIDPYDRDSMIFSDGAGACIVEKGAENEAGGILSFASHSFCAEETDYLYMGKSFFPESDSRVRYIKMKGRKVYELAMKEVPLAMKNCLDQSGADISELKKIFIHQANEKMDVRMMERFYESYGIASADIPEGVMPMNIREHGNSSVATIPTLLDQVRHGLIENQSIHSGDIVIFASIGAGMNINAVSYRF